MPDPELDVLTIAICDVCHARCIRLHYAIYYERTSVEWVKLKWWQRVPGG